MIRYVNTVLVCLLLIIAPTLSQALSGKVVSVADGDTITIIDKSKTEHRIRLYGIDTPEKGQPFGNSAKKHTSRLVAGKSVEVTPYDTDKYGRTVGVVSVNGTNVNQSLIESGIAWQYRKYCKETFCPGWLQLERKTKLSKYGLWAGTDPVPPWEWRKGARNSNYSEVSSGVRAPGSASYHGNTKSHVLHSPACLDYNCKNCTKAFDTKEAATSAGYRPCGRCKP